MKGLFITHDISIYGASRSLQGILKNIDIEYDLVVPKKLRSKNDIEAIQEFYGGKAQNIYEFYLPFEQCFVGKDEKLSWKSKINVFLKKFLFQITKYKLYSIIKEKNYDFVHLNSLVLYPCINKDLPFFIHVRELFDGNNLEDVFNSLKSAKGVIFIDKEVKKTFKDIELKKEIVLTNPIDMLDVKLYSHEKEKYINKVVYTVIGYIKKEKGIDFIIEGFNKLPIDKAVLVIVGNGEDEYISYCKSFSNQNVIFYGEEKNIHKIYAISDFVLRGDDQPRTGRTIYEALFSGCKVIIPGKELDFTFEYQKSFLDKVIMYNTRARDDFEQVIKQSFDTYQYDTREIKSNTKKYLVSFKEFLS